MSPWIKQDRNNNCGQVAVAVVTGTAVREVEKIIGHAHDTSTKELRRALRKLGYRTPLRLQSRHTFEKGNKPGVVAVIATLCRPRRRNWHWVVLMGEPAYNAHGLVAEIIYDGVCGSPDGSVCWVAGSRVTSYLPIWRKNVVHKKSV